MRAALSRSHRLRRRSTITVVLTTALATGLTACGSDDEGPSAEDELGTISVEGDFGVEPVVEFSERIDAGGFASRTLIEGDGETIEADDTVVMHAWVGNGFSETKAFETFNTSAPGIVRASTTPPSPVDVQRLQQQPIGALLNPTNGALPAAVADSIEGATVGSRVLVVSDAANAYGSAGQPGLDIGNQDNVVYVIDLLAKPLTAPEGTEQDLPEGTPEPVVEGDDVTSFDFADAAEPSGELEVVSVIEGDGPEVEDGALLIANYLGQVYDGEEPFDESYSGDLPAGFTVGEGGQVIPGWNEALPGLTHGSRVILGIPPEDGYGEEGNEAAGIGGDDTLYFVVDILGSVALPEPQPVDPPEEEPTDGATDGETGTDAPTEEGTEESTDAPSDDASPEATDDTSDEPEAEPTE